MDNELPPSGSQESSPAQGPASPPNQPPPSQGSITPPPIIPPRLTAARPSNNYGWKISVGVLAGLLVLSLFTNFWHFAHSLVPRRGPLVSSSRHAGPRLEETLVEEHGSDNKILIVPVEGVISSDMLSSGADYNMVHFIKDQFKLAAEDSDIKAVILKVESPGGEVLASDDINQIITQFQNKTGKPVIASMGSLAASGGYYVSVPCRWIVANELTLTGSIGVIFHSYNFRGLMDKVGIRPEVYKSGRYKDMLSFDKKETDITQEERDMIQNLINETFGRFKSVVAEGRAWAYKKNKDNKDDKGVELASNWADYADGRVLSGKEAYERGFVDELGNFEAAVSRAKKLANIQNANVVKYQQVFDLSNLFRLFGKSEGGKVKVDLGLDTPKLKAGQLYFLAPTFVH